MEDSRGVVGYPDAVLESYAAHDLRQIMRGTSPMPVLRGALSQFIHHRPLRQRTVANVDAIGCVVCMCPQYPAGKSSKAKGTSQSWARAAAALGDLAAYGATNKANAIVDRWRSGAIQVAWRRCWACGCKAFGSWSNTMGLLLPPAPLPAGLAGHVAQRCPKPQCAIANGQGGPVPSPRLWQVAQKVLPGRLALAGAIPEAHECSVAIGSRATNNEEARPHLFPARCKCPCDGGLAPASVPRANPGSTG